MLDDAFKLTLDKFFPLKEELTDIYKVTGYEDNENMWEPILDLKK
jgi:hypothetical protein